MPLTVFYIPELNDYQENWKFYAHEIKVENICKNHITFSCFLDKGVKSPINDEMSNTTVVLL